MCVYFIETTGHVHVYLYFLYLFIYSFLADLTFYTVFVSFWGTGWVSCSFLSPFVFCIWVIVALLHWHAPPAAHCPPSVHTVQPRNLVSRGWQRSPSRFLRPRWCRRRGWTFAALAWRAGLKTRTAAWNEERASAQVPLRRRSCRWRHWSAGLRSLNQPSASTLGAADLPLLSIFRTRGRRHAPGDKAGKKLGQIHRLLHQQSEILFEIDSVI